MYTYIDACVYVSICSMCKEVYACAHKCRTMKV